jgi:peptidyl-prolyl cis-trans isomerase A (cyclophilin A)
MAALRVVIATVLGPITAEIYPDRAPATAGAFLRLVDQGLYAGGSFYRAIRPDNDRNPATITAIQGGVDPGFTRPPGPAIAHETTQATGLLHLDGMLSMARGAPGTAASEFFLVSGDAPVLDFGGVRYPDRQGFAAFGRVVSGLEIVRAICATSTTAEAAAGYMKGQALDKPVAFDVRRLA